MKNIKAPKIRTRVRPVRQVIVPKSLPKLNKISRVLIVGSWGEPPHSSELSTYDFSLKRLPFPTLY